MGISKIIHVRSQDCLFLNNEFSVNLSEAISCSLDEEIEVEVLNASIPYSFFNVSETNGFLSIREEELDGSNALDYNLELILGNYNAVQFVSMFQTVINQQSITKGKSFVYICVYKKITNNVEISLISPNSQSNFLFKTGVIEKFDCEFLLGFSNKDFKFNTNTILLGDGSVNMSPFDAVYIHSNLGIINSYDTKNGNLTNILIKIPINTLPFSFIQFTNIQNLSYISNRNNIQSLIFQILDSDSDPINLRFANWFLSIKFTIIKKENVFELQRNSELVPVTF